MPASLVEVNGWPCLDAAFLLTTLYPIAHVPIPIIFVFCTMMSPSCTVYR